MQNSHEASRLGLCSKNWTRVVANFLLSWPLCYAVAAKMTGLLGVPQSFVDDIRQRLQQEGSPTERRSGDLEGMQPRFLGDLHDFGYFGVSDPVQCLPLGATVAWHLRPSPNPIYPVYLRNNLLNTNLNFDYGAFR